MVFLNQGQHRVKGSVCSPITPPQTHMHKHSHELHQPLELFTYIKKYRFIQDC